MQSFRIITFSLAIASLLCACRREDWRETTLDVPGLTEANKAEVASAITRYEGVDKPSISFDTAAKKVTCKFDSMKVAETNLRMAIAAKGIEVNYPDKSTGAAGYINSRAREIAPPRSK